MSLSPGIAASPRPSGAESAGSGTWAGVICGIDWVTANAGTIEVANMSLSGGGSDSACDDGGLHEAICNSLAAGVTYAVAASNDAQDAALHVPAAYDEVITVSALADFDGQPGGAGRTRTIPWPTFPISAPTST